ncbi:MAG: hypothetical protein ACPIOQ_56730 [Promethearchaeia archaeon]
MIRPGVGRRRWARTAIPAVDSAADKRDDGRRKALHTTAGRAGRAARTARLSWARGRGQGQGRRCIWRCGWGE